MISNPPCSRNPLIDSDLFCAQCGYNLRTIALDGRRPECGLDVTRTLRAGKLADADPRWLRGVGCIDHLVPQPAPPSGIAQFSN